jgi:hypothetical protein
MIAKHRGIAISGERIVHGKRNSESIQLSITGAGSGVGTTMCGERLPQLHVPVS